jgi:hypothetical protein
MHQDGVFFMATTWLEAPETTTPQWLLQRSPHHELRALSVSVTEDSLTIHGTVPTYHHKQLALETLRPLARGRKIINLVIVSGKTS